MAGHGRFSYKYCSPYSNSLYISRIILIEIKIYKAGREILLYFSCHSPFYLFPCNLFSAFSLRVVDGRWNKMRTCAVFFFYSFCFVNFLGSYILINLHIFSFEITKLEVFKFLNFFLKHFQKIYNGFSWKIIAFSHSILFFFSFSYTVGLWGCRSIHTMSIQIIIKG